MSGNQALVGSKIPLSLTVCDGVAGLTVIAAVIDCFGKQHARAKLDDIGAGVYTSLEVQMPDVPFVVVQYLVQDTDKYEIASERFDSIPKPSDEKIVDGNVFERNPVKDYVVGKVTNENTF